MMAHINICDNWLLTIVSHSLMWTQCKKACGSKQQKKCCAYRFWKLCMSAMHVDTASLKAQPSPLFKKLTKNYVMWLCNNYVIIQTFIYVKIFLKRFWEVEMVSENFVFLIWMKRLRAPSHMKFCPGVKFSISTQVEKNWCHTWVSTWGQMNIFLLQFTLAWKYICKNLQHILQKCFLEKDVLYAVTGLYKNYDIRFHQQEN